MSIFYVAVCASYTFSTENDSPYKHIWSEKNGYSQGTKNRFSPIPAAGLFCAHMLQTAPCSRTFSVALQGATDRDMLLH